MLLRYTVAALLSIYNVLAANDTKSRTTLDITSTLTVESFVTVAGSPPTTSKSSSNGLGDYIIQGLGGSNTTSSTAQALPAPATIGPFLTDNSTAAVGWEACQTSLVSWSEAWTSAYQPEVVTSTKTYTNNIDTVTFNVTLGNADVYTTIDGIPHAHGELKPTATSQFVGTYSEISKSTSTLTETLNATFLNPSPNCTFAPSKCTALWQSYLGEQGLPTTFENATEPAITPMPTERPRCAVGNVTAICEPIPQPSCIFSARKVDLYYWPVVTAAPNASLANANFSNVATQVVGTITMTSPSVYMIFDHLQAFSSTDLDSTCSKSTPLGATEDVTLAGGGAIATVGGPYTNAVVSLDPMSLSSLVRDLGPVNTASVVSEIAHGGPSYEYWVNAVQGTARNYKYQGGYYSSVLAKPVDFHNLAVPAAEAYYMNINGAPGCNRMGDHPQCSTIFDGDYRAQLLVPEQVRSLRPEWADCYDPLFGALDPPIALTPAGSIKAPTQPTSADVPIGLTTVDTIKLPVQTPASPRPTVTSNPSPTAIPNTKPGNDEPTTSNDTPASDEKPTSGIKLPEQAPATTEQTVPSNPSPTAISDTKPNDGSDDKPTSDDTPASGDDTESDDKPDSDDQPSSDDTPAPNDKPSSDGKPVSDDKPASNDAPASDDKPTSSDKPTSDDKPDSDASPGSTSDSNDDNPKVDEGSPTNTSPSDTSSNDDQGSSQSGDDGKELQNALDVLTAALQSDAAKETTLPDGGATSDPAKGKSEGEHNANGQENEGDSNTAGSDSKNPPPTQVVEIDGTKHTVAAQNGAPVVDGTTVPTDGSPKTIDRQVVSAVEGGIAIGTETVRLGGGQFAVPEASQNMILTVHGQTFTASPASTGGALIIDGITIAVGQTATTLHDATISAASDGIVVDGSTATYNDQTAVPVDNHEMTFTANGQTFTASPATSGGAVVIGGTTITVSQAAATLHGVTISAVSGGIVVDGSTATYGDQTAVLVDSQKVTFMAQGQTFTASPASSGGAIIIDGTTISVGHAAATLHGAIISAASDGLVVDGSTVSYADASGSPHPAVITLGSSIATASAVSSGVFAIGTVTLTAGESGTTVSGHVVSAASDGIVVDGSTVSYADATASGRPAVLTLGSNVATASQVSSGVFAIGTVTLTAGESGTTISGHVVSAASTGIVIDGASTSTDASGTQGEQGTQSTSSGSEPDATSLTASGAANDYIIQWAVMMGCGLVFLL